MEDDVWVLGATGFLGRHMALRLASRGFRVIGIGRREFPNSEIWGIDKFYFGLLGSSLYQRVCDDWGKPRIVVHSVGSGSVGQAASDPAADLVSTVSTTEGILDFISAKSPNTRLIYISSAAVYGASGMNSSSDRVIKPVSEYGRNKSFAEIYCLKSCVDVKIARLFSIFGSPQRKLLLWDIGQKLLAGQKTIVLGGVGSERRDFLHVSEATSALANMAQKRECPPIVEIGSGRFTTISNLANKFANLISPGSRVTFDGTKRLNDPFSQQANISNLRTIGFLPSQDLDFGLREYSSWIILQHKISRLSAKYAIKPVK